MLGVTSAAVTAGVLGGYVVAPLAGGGFLGAVAGGAAGGAVEYTTFVGAGNIGSAIAGRSAAPQFTFTGLAGSTIGGAIGGGVVHVGVGIGTAVARVGLNAARSSVTIASNAVAGFAEGFARGGRGFSVYSISAAVGEGAERFANGVVGAVRRVNGAVRANQLDTFQGFKNRSEIGDRLEGHELLQHAWLERNGYATTRLSTTISKENPVIALKRPTHQIINAAQQNLDLDAQTAIQNILANRRIMLELGFSRTRVNKLAARAVMHAMENGL